MRVIEFVGPPAAGKSTQIDQLVSHCQAKGLTAVTTNDRGRISKIGTPHTERMVFGVVLAAQSVEFYHEQRLAAEPPDVLFLDRGWNDIRVWAEFEYLRSAIKSEERAAMKTVFASYAKLVERTVYMTVPVDVAIERHKQREALAVDALTMEPEYLKGLAKAYETHWYQLHRPHRVDGRRPREVITEELAALLKL